MNDDDVLTAEGLWQRCEAKRAVALAMVEDRKHCREAWMASGFAVEFALKATIMRRDGFNTWPSRDHRPGLYTHDLRKLLAAARIDVAATPKAVRAALRTVLDWQRDHDYKPGAMPRKVARSMCNAAFGADGVVAWLRTL